MSLYDRENSLPETRFLPKTRVLYYRENIALGVHSSYRHVALTHSSLKRLFHSSALMASFEDYDEFGNYIGADIDSDEEGGDADAQVPHAPQRQPLEGYDDEAVGVDPGTSLMEVDGESYVRPMRAALKTTLSLVEPVHNAVILHEDKQYYPSASDVYGEGVETLVQEEDAQPLTEPIIAPVKVRKWTVEEKGMPETRFDKGYVIPYTAGITPLTGR